MKIKDTSALILAGGKSNRMGFPKALLKANKNKTFLEKIVSTYLENNIKVIVVLYEKALKFKILKTIVDKLRKKGIEFIINKEPELGRFYSILLGISKIKVCNNMFIHNIDNPFVNSDLLSLMLNKLEKKSYVVPTYNGKGGHPVLLDKEIVAELKKTVLYDINFKDFLVKFKKISISYNNKDILLNINSLDDYNKYIKEQLIYG